MYSINEINKFTENPVDRFNSWEAFSSVQDLLHLFVRTRIPQIEIDLSVRIFISNSKERFRYIIPYFQALIYAVSNYYARPSS